MSDCSVYVERDGRWRLRCYVATDSTARLTEQVTLRRATTAADGAGGLTQAWSDLGTRWAHVELKRGRELERGDATRAQATYEIVLRRDATTAALSPTDRVVVRGDECEIVVVDAPPRSSWVRIEAVRL